jgi:hypothetical protein
MGAFDLNYGSARDLTPEMVTAGQSPSVYVASSTSTAGLAPTEVVAVDASGCVVVWGVTIVTAETSLQAYELYESADSGTTQTATIVVGGATNSGPYFYSFDTPHLCTKGNDLYISGLAGTGTSYCCIYYSTVAPAPMT